MCEPLVGKKIEDDFDGYIDENTPFKVPLESLKSAVKGLIKYHESNIEEIEMMYKISKPGRTPFEQRLLNINHRILLKQEIKAIMAIELWLEDAVEIEPKCEMCGCPESFHYKEIVPTSPGGTSNQEHLICKNCGVCF